MKSGVCVIVVIIFMLVLLLQAQPFNLEQNYEKVSYQYKIEKWLNTIDSNLSEFNLLAGHLTWKLSTAESDEKSAKQARQLSVVRNRWKNKICESKLVKRDWLTDEQQRKLYLFCRGPKFTDQSILDYFEITGQLSEEYNEKICLNATTSSQLLPFLTETCVNGEPDLERLMKQINLNHDQLKLIWLEWHNDVGPRIKPLFKEAVDIQNEAARRNGYSDIGEAWREELEMDNLEKFVMDLYEEIAPLYVLLHAVVRHSLWKKYGEDVIDPMGPIPIHLLGNMWAQDWSALIDDIYKDGELGDKIDLDARLRRKNITVKDMVLEAEDFYTSLSLPKMTPQFWKHSIFEQNENDTALCHGTAANLYNHGDVRMIMCGKTTMEDLYVIHHEMGHVEYYMAYEQQPAFFQDGTNTAFHESIGDVIMHAVMTPQHLHRLNLLTDKQLTNPRTEFILLLQQALSKLPEIPFALIMDKFRWDIFKGKIPDDKWNNYYWQLNRKFRGIKAPNIERETNSELFDAGAKFHIPDNTPYIRYFLSGILQMQLFKSLCELSMYGNNRFDGGTKEYDLPLQRCDIYGSKNAGKKLMAMMEKGASIHWTEALKMVTGEEELTADALLEYYRPLQKWLVDYIETNNVYVGW